MDLDQLTYDLNPEPVELQPENEPIAVVGTADQTVTLSDVQFSYLTEQIDNQANNLRNDLVWIGSGIFALIGILVILAFWKGWSSNK